MKIAAVRAFAMSLPEVTEEPHQHFGSFRVRGKIFVTMPPGEERIHVFVPEQEREQALAMYPAFTEKLLWGSKALGVRVSLAHARPGVVKSLVLQAWRSKAPRTLREATGAIGKQNPAGIRRHRRPSACRPRVTVRALREHPEHCAFFAAAFEAEWPTWYGPGGPGDAMADLLSFANGQGAIPVGVVALERNGEPIGVAALKATSVPSHSHLTPWAAAGYVAPAWRRQGVGALLLEALLREAARLGHATVFCATSTSASLLERQGWHLLESVRHEGHALQVFRSSSRTDAA